MIAISGLKQMHGGDAFERLTAQLLGSLINKRFFLTKSGFQGGRDMSIGHRNANVIGI
jgi:hypothetical protein